MKLPVVVSRIAPTPSGFLHAGNGYNFILTWLMTRSQGGKLFLRIDDLDAPRLREEYVEDFFQTLLWLGLEVDEGPDSVAALTSVWSQRYRLDTYQTLLDRLAADDLLFACTRSRKDILAVSPKGIYPASFRNQPCTLSDPEVAWRVKTDPPAEVSWNDLALGRQTVDLALRMSDFVVRRKEGLPSYQLASVSDDVEAGVNLVVRGMDLRDSTAAQLYLAQLLKLDSFTNIAFLHHPLLLDAQGNKLSKSAGATSLKAIRERTSRPAAYFQQLAPSLGLPLRAYQSLQDMLDEFDPARLSLGRR